MGRPLATLGAVTASVMLGCASMQLEIPEVPGWLFAPEPPAPIELVEGATVELPAPKGVRAVSGEYRAIPLKWAPVLTGDVGGYLVETAPTEAEPFERLIAIRGRGTLAIVDQGGIDGRGDDNGTLLSDGQTRYYRLRVFTQAGEISQVASETVVATTAPLPGSPRDLRAYSRQPREVPLSWTASADPNVSGYAIERSPAPAGPFITIAEPEGRHATTYVDGPLGDLRVFYYRVSARNPGGARGEASETVRAVTKPEPLPPLGLRVAERRLGANVLEWEPNVESDLVEYHLYRMRGNGEAERVTSVSAGQLRAVDDSVASGEIVAYGLVAMDRDGLESRRSSWETVESEHYGLTSTFGPEGVRITWRPRTDEGYVRARLTRSTWLSRSRTADVESGGFVDGDVDPGKRYRYQVTLLRSDGSLAPASRILDVTVPEEDALR